MSVDYSDIERRILLHITDAVDDAHIRKAMEIYGITADQVTPEMRRRAKAISFADMYGVPMAGKPRHRG